MERVAVVSGVRTPFVKAGTAFNNVSMQELGAAAIKALVARTGIDPKEIDEVVMGTVLLDPRTPNWAREMVFKAGLPRSVYADSVSNNCISGLVAVSRVADRIARKEIKTAIAGGSESMSKPALLFRKHAADIFFKLNKARSTADKLKLLLQFRPKDLLPLFPSVAEPSTGLTMGQHMEITAKQLGIKREDQDKIAFDSHQNAAKATADGRLTAEIEPLLGVSKDLLVRSDTTLEKLSTLKPVFDRSSQGTLTAGNSSALTDGASVVLLMSESQAKADGREPLAFVSAYEYAAIDPNDGLLMAPAIAVPRMLRRLGLCFDDFDLIEIHEAFAAQVLANIKAWEEGWKEPAIGKLDRSKVNTLGGSIAIGHPFAATGGRIITTLANELKRRGLKRGLISICAAGAMAGAMIIERD